GPSSAAIEVSGGMTTVCTGSVASRCVARWAPGSSVIGGSVSRVSASAVPGCSGSVIRCPSLPGSGPDRPQLLSPQHVNVHVEDLLAGIRSHIADDPVAALLDALAPRHLPGRAEQLGDAAGVSIGHLAQGVLVGLRDDQHVDLGT